MTPLLLALLALAPDAGRAPDAGVLRCDAGACADAGLDAGVRPALVRSPDGGLPPHALACLTNWYAGTVTWRADGGWGLQLPDASVLPWDNGTDVRDPESELAPDLEDVFEPPYRAGPIVPLDSSDAGAIEDPGRVRIEQLFLATYGGSKAEVTEHLVKVRFFGLRYPFHEKAAPALTRVVERLTAAVKENPKLLPFLSNIGGTWHWRRISRSKNLSAHAYGIAIDLNVDRAHYWRWQKRGEPLKWQNRYPQAIVDAFEAEGFIWGGRWLHYDTMHFEYRPELTSPTCR